ncbi:NUDIX hydrolase [Desulfitobacterium sp. THU1]|uniref:NUDIX hydrolase n=1 Tax=Desulfitobacterium sp. THU1 TaxID=3138072 RepID=UPI00311FB878
MSLSTNNYRFCPQCGNPLHNSELYGQIRSHCTACSFVFWGNFSLGVGGVVWHEGKVLLVQRAHNPGKGVWTLPGGYVDQQEKIADAVVREIWEETHLQTRPLSVIALRDRPGEKHDTYIVFLLEYLEGELLADPEEVSDIGFFTLEEAQALMIAELSLSVIKASLTQRLQGFLPKSGVAMVGGERSVLYQIPEKT